MAEQKRGRVTPRRTERGTSTRGRYTPPIPRAQRESPRWVPVLMFVLLTLGVLVIFANYINLLPGNASNGYLLLGLGLITGGFVVATNYH